MHWNDGLNKYMQPRVIHCMDDTVLLVSAVLACSNNHQTISHDERILKHIPHWTPGCKGSRECAYAARRGVITRYRVISRRILRACVNVRNSVRRRDYAKYRVT